MTYSSSGMRGLLLGFLLLRPAGCGGDTGGGYPSPPKKPCYTNGDDKWASYIWSYVLKAPKYCPIEIFARGYTVHFTFTAEAATGNVVPDNATNSLVGWIDNWHGTNQAVFTDAWEPKQNDPALALATLDGGYPAGTGTGEARDTADLQTLIFPFTGPYDVAKAGAGLPAIITVSASISGPSNVQPGDYVTITLGADLQSFEGAATYNWQVNGVDQSVNANSITRQFTQPGDYTFVGTVFDQVSHAGESSMTVYVRYPECQDCLGPGIRSRRLKGMVRGSAHGGNSDHTVRGLPIRIP